MATFDSGRQRYSMICKSSAAAPAAELLAAQADLLKVSYGSN
jgi:hypothetical protein